MTKLAESASLLRLALARQLVEGGSLTDLRWCEAVETVPREAFIGDAIYQPGEGGERGAVWEPQRRNQFDKADWLRLVYTDETWITQVDGVLATDALGA